MNVVSNEQVSNVVVSNERGLKWSGLKWMVSNELVSIVCTPEYAYCVNKLCQNVGLEMWIWRHIV